MVVVVIIIIIISIYTSGRELQCSSKMCVNNNIYIYFSLVLPGIQYVCPIDQYPLEKWNEMMAITVTAPFMLIKHFLPKMKEKGKMCTCTRLFIYFLFIIIYLLLILFKLLFLFLKKKIKLIYLFAFVCLFVCLFICLFI